MKLCTCANTLAVYLNQQSLQRRATPHPSELKVMKNVIEARRNEAYTAKPDEDLESPDSEVNSNKGTIVLFYLVFLVFFFLSFCFGSKHASFSFHQFEWT